MERLHLVTFCDQTPCAQGSFPRFCFASVLLPSCFRSASVLQAKLYVSEVSERSDERGKDFPYKGLLLRSHMPGMISGSSVIRMTL